MKCTTKNGFFQMPVCFTHSFSLFHQTYHSWDGPAVCQMGLALFACAQIVTAHFLICFCQQHNLHFLFTLPPLPLHVTLQIPSPPPSQCLPLGRRRLCRRGLLLTLQKRRPQPHHLQPSSSLVKTTRKALPHAPLAWWLLVSNGALGTCLQSLTYCSSLCCPLRSWLTSSKQMK